MDQAKWAVPRSRHGADSHAVARHEKPRLKLHVCWLHGVGVHFFLVDPRVQADASMVLECGARALEHLHQKSKQLGRPAPTQLAVLVTWKNENPEVLQILSLRQHLKSLLG